ncbi:hypothetical protein LEMLEM_LOCUS6813, partial [Lemmus lemmus]
KAHPRSKPKEELGGSDRHSYSETELGFAEFSHASLCPRNCGWRWKCLFLETEDIGKQRSHEHCLCVRILKQSSPALIEETRYLDTCDIHTDTQTHK